jgi:hypothetical protein
LPQSATVALQRGCEYVRMLPTPTARVLRVRP